MRCNNAAAVGAAAVPAAVTDPAAAAAPACVRALDEEYISGLYGIHMWVRVYIFMYGTCSCE